MLPIADYHIHTYLCGHASGEPREYVEHAIKIGLKEIGFSDHAPLVALEDPCIAMSIDQLPDYQQMIETLREEYKNKINIKIAIEADFFPGHESKTKKIIKGYPYDYVIGSVHYMEDWGFDNPIHERKWKEKDIDQVYRDYYGLLRRSAESGLYDVIAHADLVKKFGHRPTNNLIDEVKKTAEIFKNTGMVLEINTSGLRKPAKEIYPSLINLDIYAAAKVPIIFSSDAHSPTDVGRDFDLAVKHAKDAGYREYVLFKNRKIEKVVKIG